MAKKKKKDDKGLGGIDWVKAKPASKEEIRKSNRKELPKKILNIAAIGAVIIVYFNYIFNSPKGNGGGLVFAFSIMLAVTFMIYKISDDHEPEKKICFWASIILGILILIAMAMG